MFHEYCHIDTTVTPRVHPKKFEFKATLVATVVDDWSENFFVLAPVQAYAYVQSLGQLDSLPTNLPKGRS
jgi:hypothetical protein